MDVGDIRVELSLVYSQFKSALKNVEKMSRKTGKTLENTLGTKLTTSLKGVDKAVSSAFGGKNQRDIQKTTGLLGAAGSKTYGYLKDVKRIASGILLSQVLYRGILQPIQAASKALWDFVVQMEQAYLALELILGGLGQATLFLRELEAFAAVTPFQMGDVVTNTRQLLGYGFAAQEVLPILEALSDASAIIGVSPAQLNQLVATLGKVRAQGRMMARQLISFGAAGIPIFQILREELGLTKEEIRNIGKQAEGQANIVIPAILRGLERKFGGASERLARTVGGLLSTIEDDLLLISKDVTAGLYETFRGFLSGVTDRLEELRDIVVKYGVGGLFEAIVPEQYQESLRQMIAHLISFGRALAQLWQALAPVRQILFDVFINVMSMVIPLLSIASQALAKFAHWAFYSNTVLSRLAISLVAAITVMKAFTIVLSIAQAISKLAAMVGLASVAMNKWGIVIMAVLAALIALAMSIPKVRTAIQGLWEQLMGFFGLDTSKLLQPIEVEDVIDADALYDQLHVVHEETQQVEKDFKDVEDQVKDTQKALKKYLLAFDEVYAIPEKYPDIALPGISDIEIPEPEMMFEPEMEWPDWTEPAEQAIGELGDMFGDLLNKIAEFFKRVKDFIVDWAKLWWQTIKDLAQVYWQFIKDIYNAFKQFFVDIWNMIKQFGADIYRAAVTFVVDIIQLFVTFFSDIWQAIVTAVQDWIAAFKQFFSELANAENFKDVWNAFVNLFKNIGKLIYQFGYDIGAAFMKAFKSFGVALHDLGANLTKAVINLVNNAINAVSNLITKLIQAYKDFITKTISIIINYYMELGALVKQYFPGLFEILSSFVLKLETVVTAFIQRVIQSFKALGPEIVASFRALGTQTLAFFRQVGQSFITLGSIITKTVGGMFSGLMDRIINAAQRMMTIVKRMVNMALELINKIPGVDIAPIKIGSYSPSGYNVPPGMAKGGILNKEQIVRAAEAGRPEAYTPLTAEALKPWAEAIASALGGGAGDSTQEPSIQETSYIAVPIDKKGMMDLDKKLFVLRRRENIRRSVGVTV